MSLYADVRSGSDNELGTPCEFSTVWLNQWCMWLYCETLIYVSHSNLCMVTELSYTCFSKFLVPFSGSTDNICIVKAIIGGGF